MAAEQPLSLTPDLVRRLRDKAAKNLDPIIEEAADEIERLEAKWRAEGDAFIDAQDEIKQQRDLIQTLNFSHHQFVEWAEPQIVQHGQDLKEIERLQFALEQISRMRCHPDKSEVILTLTAAIELARATLDMDKERPPRVKPDANGRLITAAPDLLAACKEISTMDCPYSTSGFHDIATCRCEIAKAARAVAKAEGQS
jgi:hypothetical protein